MRPNKGHGRECTRPRQALDIKASLQNTSLPTVKPTSGSLDGNKGPVTVASGNLGDKYKKIANVLEFWLPSKDRAWDCLHRGATMVCKVCNSENLQKLEGELTASLPSLQGLEVPPIYVCQNVLVCMECGFTELVIPTAELLSLKNAKAAPGS